MGYTASIGGEINTACRPERSGNGFNEDRLTIVGAHIEDDDINANLFCGSSLAGKTVVSEAPGPISVNFHSDQLYRADIPERGFEFTYTLL